MDNKYESMNVNTLKTICRAKNIKVGGKNPEIIKRLIRCKKNNEIF